MDKENKVTRYKCLLCGRNKFTRKSPHHCVGGFRKRNIKWEIIETNDSMELEKEISRQLNPNFFKLWDLKLERSWYSQEIYAKTTRDLEMNVWNGKHPVDKNKDKHICKAGTKVKIWMVSRFGDVGITDNLENPIGYAARVDPDIDLTDYEFIKY